VVAVVRAIAEDAASLVPDGVGGDGAGGGGLDDVAGGDGAGGGQAVDGAAAEVADLVAGRGVLDGDADRDVGRRGGVGHGAVAADVDAGRR
jgi:hypothetical protein